jgi:hypothetical protein
MSAQVESTARPVARGSAAVGWDPITSRLAIAGGAIGLFSLASLVAFFIVGGPFGATNDWAIAAVGCLTGLLAVAQWRRDERTGPRTGVLPVWLAVAGAAVVIVGAWLVISDTTGYLLAGLVESLGFALIGVWLFALNRSPARAERGPRRLTRLGVAAGLVMTLGFLVVPAIAAGLDDSSAAPVWVWIGFLGWLGTFFLYPVWSLWIGLQRPAHR